MIDFPTSAPLRLTLTRALGRAALALLTGLALVPAARAQAVPAMTRLPPAATAASAPDGAASAPGPGAGATASPKLLRALQPAPEAPEPGEFERLATEANGGRTVRRFGSQMRRVEAATLQQETPARVPPAYVVQVGDEITVTAWGGIDGEWRLRVDRSGRISIPRVGPVPVAGVTAGELARLMRERFERVYRGFELSTAVTEVTPMRVQITGFVERPGDYVLPALSTISRAIALADGPSAGGSFRRIRLLRGGATVETFDLYALLDGGRRSADALLQPDDVLNVDAVGPQAALLGSVNRPAVFEFLPGETVADLLRMAGGFSSVADRARLNLERLPDRARVGAVELPWPAAAAQALQDGDIVRALSQVMPSLPTRGRNKRVRVDGEVARPGEYLLPPDATLADAVAAAGGATGAAFLYGTELRRESVRLVQEANYERALQELEAEVDRSANVRAKDENAAANEASTRQLLARLRTRRPEGRMVLELQPDSTALPLLEVEDGDQIRIAARSQSVGVFGSVFNGGSFVHEEGRRVGDYLRRAGGPTAGADYDSAFIVRANGSVSSARQQGYWTGTQQFEAQAALPGDTVFVPEKLDRITLVQGAKEWTQILYQFALGVAGIRALR